MNNPICYWCGSDASLTKDGDMYYRHHPTNKIICASCSDRDNSLKIKFGSGLRADRRQPEFQLTMFGLPNTARTRRGAGVGKNRTGKAAPRG